jgi:hypothetical protein
MPFDNDAAADFAGDLDNAPQSERINMLRSALVSVVDDVGTRINGGTAEVAIAAAALTVRETEGGDEFQSEICGPSCELPVISQDLTLLALDSVPRLLAGSSDLWDDWSKREGGEVWVSVLQRLKSVLIRKSSGSQESLW